MRLLDRYIIRSFLYNYLLAFGVMVGMYTLLDLIINFERFTHIQREGLSGFASFFALLADIADYYGYQMLVIFQQVSAAIPTLAAGFTMVRMTRHNELTAMLASGVSLYRVAAPIVLCSIVFSLLVIVDQEFLMPRCVDKLLRKHDEVGQVADSKLEQLHFVRDKDGSLFSALYDSRQRVARDVRIIKRDADGRSIGRIMAEEAAWVPGDAPNADGPGGHWHLSQARQIDDTTDLDPALKVAEQVSNIEYSTSLTPEQLKLILSKKAVEFLSSGQIQMLVVNSPEVTRDGLEKIMHIRFTQPIMNLILLLIGIPFLLTREPRRLIVNMLYCTAVTAVCFVGTFVFFQMAGTVFSPLVGAWLPVLIFGPVAVAMLDTIKT